MYANDIAISGAAAVAAAVSVAMTENATLRDIIQAGLYGAEEGEKRGAKASRCIAGANVLRRMNLAIELVMRARFEGFVRSCRQWTSDQRSGSNSIRSTAFVWRRSHGEPVRRCECRK